MSQPAQGSRLLSRLLPVAIKLWLRSQLDRIEGLTLAFEATDRQLLGGRLPGVLVSAQRVIYKGIHLSAVSLRAADVQINLGQVLRGKPLRLLTPFPVRGQAQLSAADISVSAQSALLSAGVGQFWQTLLHRPEVAAELVQHYGKAILQDQQGQFEAGLAGDRLCLSRVSPSGRVTLQASLAVDQGRILRLVSPAWVVAEQVCPSRALVGFQWDLGSDAQVEKLVVQSDRLICQGTIQIRP